MGSRQADPFGPTVETSSQHSPLEEVLKLCKQRPREVYVGYSGGGDALRRATGEKLRGEMTWKWHDPGANQRVADPWNWIPGAWFLDIVDPSMQVSNWER